MKTFLLVWGCLALGVAIGWALRARLERNDPFRELVLREGADQREVQRFLESLDRRAG